MSVGLLTNPDKLHDVEDDLEHPHLQHFGRGLDLLEEQLERRARHFLEASRLRIGGGEVE